MPEVSQSAIVAVIIGMAFANFAIRYVPLSVVSRLELPPAMLRWLSFIPVSVMGALVATEVLRPGGEAQQPLTNPGVYAAILTAIVFRYTRSFLGATVSGMAAFVILRAILG